MAYKNPIPKIKDEYEGKPEPESDYTSRDDIYFVFIDVLGFKKTFDDMKISHKQDIAEKYRKVFNYYFSLMEHSEFMNKKNNTNCYAGQTSDSLYFYTDRTEFLMQFIKLFSHFSLYAMSENVFFRGGIAKGSLYKKAKYQFYGSSVIGAYLMESNISKNPIITIDEETHKDMCNDTEYKDFVLTKNNRNFIKPFIWLTKKFSLDINPIFPLEDINEENIKYHIQNNKKIFEYDEQNFSKYVFLLDEWNNHNKSEATENTGAK